MTVISTAVDCLLWSLLSKCYACIVSLRILEYCNCQCFKRSCQLPYLYWHWTMEEKCKCPLCLCLCVMVAVCGCFHVLCMPACCLVACVRVCVVWVCPNSMECSSFQDNYCSPLYVWSTAFKCYPSLHCPRHVFHREGFMWLIYSLFLQLLPRWLEIFSVFEKEVSSLYIDTW